VIVRRQRLRLGFLTHVEGGRTLAESYANAVELFVAADELGFDSGWVAQHHFSDDPTSGLPSPWVFLAHVAARTTSIRIGTAVTLASIEDPVRLAEDVGVVDILSGGRVELGVGSGFGESTFRVFGRDHDRRRERTTENFARVRAALRGESLDAEGTVLKPLSSDLADHRAWHAVFSTHGAGLVAAEGANLLLNRAAYGYDEPTDIVQRPWADRYLADWNQPRPARIGLSRLIFPAADRAESLRHLGDGLRSAAKRMSMGGPSGGSLDEALVRFHAFYGHPEEVVDALLRERVLPVATDLLAQFNPAKPTLDASIRALQLLAEDIAPQLGWSRAGPSLTPGRAPAHI
jgi:alkanesulfonate monooxygenase SsuD/methylene tetrahydromethanopterin reductase-like flavin-dependent oxidoreductase (luciferase family)